MASEGVIKQWEAFFAQSPLGVSYQPDQSGQMSPKLQQAIIQLNQKLQAAGMPLVILDSGPSGAQKSVQYIQSRKPAAQPAAQPAQPTTEEMVVSPQGKLVMAWRTYLGVGEATNTEIDDALRQAIQKAEGMISTKVPSTKGMILQGNQINPQTPPVEYDAALKLLQQQERGQQKEAVAMPTMDALGPPPERTDRPMATKFVPSDEDTKIETGDPDSTQKQGVMGQKLPAGMSSEEEEEMAEKPPEPAPQRRSLDDRMMGMMDLIEKTP